MNKAVLISIRPKWCERIANKQKTIEVRKTFPKIETPFKCYIYESHGDKEYYKTFHEKTIGKVIGEFVCDRIYRYSAEFARGKAHEEGMTITDDDMVKQSCLTPDELFRYENSGNNHRWGLLGWHISDLVIYDTPKELGEFSKYSDFVKDKRPCKSFDAYMFDYCENMMVCGYDFDGADCPKMKLTRPPQSWCYVEELDGS